MTDAADGPQAAARYADAVLARSRAGIARAITLVESSRPDHRVLAQHVLTRLLPQAGQAQRVGITGVPGVGKSTFIDALGGQLIDQGHRVAVLAVDPSSTRSGGSILGDKTRMTRLATDPAAFVRPSPTAGTLGGVARATRESLVVMAAAGYDVLLVETVGVGQSETLVAEMTDTFLLLALARTGDQLQGIKKGVLELADVVAVNKADGPHEDEARRAARELAGALRLLGRPDDGWSTPVVTCSALTGNGLSEVWSLVESHQRMLTDSGELDRRRRDQRVSWMWSLVRDQLLDRLRDSGELNALAPQLEADVRDGSITPGLAAQRLVDAFLPDRTSTSLSGSNLVLPCLRTRQQPVHCGPRALVRVHFPVCTAQHLLDPPHRREPALWLLRLADEAKGAGHLQTEPPRIHGFAGDRPIDALQQQGRVCLVRPAYHHDELVPADAGHHVGVRQVLGQTPAGHPQHLVTDGVPVRIVDVLEAVEVAENHRQRRLRGQQLLEPLLEQDPVCQARQRVGSGLVAQVRLTGGLLGERRVQFGLLTFQRLHCLHCLLVPARVENCDRGLLGEQLQHVVDPGRRDAPVHRAVHREHADQLAVRRAQRRY